MMNTSKNLDRHPCFNKKASGSCGRVHLPVAPRCNIRCNYCNRKYDCVNESRPGVASAVLTPPRALDYMREVLEREPRISVAGIAGPGDPMANPEQTLTTMRLLKEHYPELIFCLSTNGLGLPAHLDELAEVGVTHVTVTINAVDPKIGARIYSFVRDGNVLYRGEMAAELLLHRQMEALRGLKRRGIIVKVNTIVLPGINDRHATSVASAVSKLGADLMNMIPVHPTADTPFASMPQPRREQVRELRSKAGEFVPQMTHCRRCRADAVGMLCKDLSGEMSGVLKKISRAESELEKQRPYVAVATREGMLVNRHLGEADKLQIFAKTPEGYKMIEERRTPAAGCGPSRWEKLAAALWDCRAVLAEALGETPRKILMDKGIAPVEAAGFIEQALDVVYSGGDTAVLRGRRGGVSGGCNRTGNGCG